MAKDMLVRGQEKVSRQKGRVGVFLRVQLTFLDYFLLYPVINRETKFAFTNKALVILSVRYWQTKVK